MDRHDVVIDLGTTFPIDRVAIFSVSAVFQGKTIPRYGFPERFVIEVADTADFRDGDVLLKSEELKPMIRPKFPV